MLSEQFYEPVNKDLPNKTQNSNKQVVNQDGSVLPDEGNYLHKMSHNNRVPNSKYGCPLIYESQKDSGRWFVVLFDDCLEIREETIPDQ